MSFAFVVCLNVFKATCLNNVDPNQTAPVGSGSELFVLVLKLTNNVRKFLQQTTSEDDFFQIHFCRPFNGLIHVIC